jgi:hypothetical protein
MFGPSGASTEGSGEARDLATADTAPPDYLDHPALPGHTERFGQILADYRANGFSKSVASDSLDMTKHHISAGLKSGGQFGTTIEEWSDIRAAMKMFGKEGRFGEFVIGVNDWLRTQPHGEEGPYHLDIRRIPAHGKYSDITVVCLRGGTPDDSKSANQGFAGFDERLWIRFL